ncbi:MAG: hypothetical protein JO066_08010 [Verrucomicrobia bacterium]|nr:hypothetical protein [Verrucomicrobiota bacterium]
MNSAGGFFTTQTDAWQRKKRRGGCGCCGSRFAFLLLLFALILLGVGFVSFSAKNRPSGIAATAAVLLPSTTFTRQTYIAAGQKFTPLNARGLTRGTALILGSERC